MGNNRKRCDEQGPLSGYPRAANAPCRGQQTPDLMCCFTFHLIFAKNQRRRRAGNPVPPAQVRRGPPCSQTCPSSPPALSHQLRDLAPVSSLLLNKWGRLNDFQAPFDFWNHYYQRWEESFPQQRGRRVAEPGTELGQQAEPSWCMSIHPAARPLQNTEVKPIRVSTLETDQRG